MFIINKPTMESGQFYMTLPSNSSMSLFPQNTLAEYKVKLPYHVDLNGTWEVGMASITFPRTWFNIQNNDRRFYYDDGSGMFTVALLPIGFYATILDVINTLNETLKNEGVKGISFELNSRSQKVTIKFRNWTKTKF